MQLGSPKRILIKTYLHESGLWYLGLSLYNELTRAGHKVRFIPKSKFIKRHGRYARTYLPGIKEYSDLAYSFDPEVDVGSQVARAVQNHRAQMIISMETLMESSSWVRKVKKRTGVKVIDVPMLEWVTPLKLRAGAYNIFNEIWATTDITQEVFKREGNSKVKRVSWNYVDRDLFFKKLPSPIDSDDESFVFYHQGSLNPTHSSKNTELVLKAFSRLSKEYNLLLFLTGNNDRPELNKIIEKHTNINVYNRVLSRRDIADLYRDTDCVVAPSSKEGLGLSLFEAEACGCELITTDAPPMNSHTTKYLCKTSSLQTDGSLVPIANLTVDSVYEQMKKVYEDKNVR